MRLYRLATKPQSARTSAPQTRHAWIAKNPVGVLRDLKVEELLNDAIKSVRKRTSAQKNNPWKLRKGCVKCRKGCKKSILKPCHKACGEFCWVKSKSYDVEKCVSCTSEKCVGVDVDGELEDGSSDFSMKSV